MLVDVVRTYVRLRHEVVEIPYWMAERWADRGGYIGAHSTSPVWAAFTAHVGLELDAMRAVPYRRTVTVDRVQRVSGRGCRYVAQFSIHDSPAAGAAPGSESRHRFEARLQLHHGIRAQAPDPRRAPTNPFGIFVAAYDVAQLVDSVSDPAAG